MKSIYFALLTVSLLLWSGCDEGGGGGQAGDCTRAAFACSPGFTCANLGGGRTDCIPSRDSGGSALDALVLTDQGGEMDAIVTQDEGIMKDEGAPPEDASGTAADAMSVTSSDASGMETNDAAPMETSDASSGPEDVDAMPPMEMDSGMMVEPDAAPAPIEDAGPAPIIDAAPPIPDMAPPPMEADMGPENNFGPGRCNWGGMLPREARDMGGQDQNSARPIQPGRYEGLTVGGADFSDWHRVEVCEDGVLMLRVTHGFNGADVDLDVWHPQEGRLGQSQGLCTGTESFRWQNDGEIVDIRFNIYPFAPAGFNGNAEYTLEVLLACP